MNVALADSNLLIAMTVRTMYITARRTRGSRSIKVRLPHARSPRERCCDC